MDLTALAVAAGLIGWTPPPVATPKAVPHSAPAAAAAATVVASPSGATIAWDALIDALVAVRVIAVGERHDQAAHHQVQADVLAAVAARDPQVVVGFEMVSQDQQAGLDDFLSGKTSEAAFADWWKKTAWGYDYAIYKPIFDVIRAKHLHAVGLNAPIGLVKIVAKKGLAGLSPAQRAQLPADIRESDDARYRDFVKESVSGHGLPPEAVARMLTAQAVWNETMGAKTAELAASSRVVVIAGQGHMLWRAGVPESALRRGAASAAVVLPFPPDGESMTIPDQLKRLRDPASGELATADDFVLVP